MTALKDVRHARRLSQTALGAAAVVSTSTISLIENGRLRPSAGQAAKIARALGVEPRAVRELAEAVGAEGRQDG